MSLSALEKVSDEEYIFRPAVRFYTRLEQEKKCVIKQEFTVEHLKLLYMISKFGLCAVEPTDQESWIREVPLFVLLFEGITKEAFDFDYAPLSVQVSVAGGQRRLWMNISQEGKSATDDLREGNLLNGLKITTADSLPITALQLSERGRSLLQLLSTEVTDVVDSFLYPEGAPRTEDYLLQAQFVPNEDEDEEGFYLSNKVPETDKFYVSRQSDATESEDVSYVSSPYLPRCLRNTDRDMLEMTSNADQAYKSAAGDNNIDAELSEMFVTKNMRAMVTEWIPFGANQIVGLNDRLGALDRCQGGFFTNQTDDNPTDTALETGSDVTNVKILDFDYIRFTNFEANINYAEAEGIIQVEFFGMHLNVSGNVIYGMEIEAIGARQKDDISIDELSRLLVDVHQDSSEIMDDLLTPYQRILIDMVYSGDAPNRPKYNMLICDELCPYLPANMYIDRSERECELKQVLGDLFSATDLGDDHMLILGRAGCLFAGNKAKDYDSFIVVYLLLMSLDGFLKCYFSRTFRTDVTISQSYDLVEVIDEDPNNLQKLREQLSEVSKELILLKAILDFMTVSHNNVVLPEAPDEELDPVGSALYNKLNMKTLHHDLGLRLTDLVKLINGADSKTKILTQTSNTLTRRSMANTVNSIDANYQALVAAAAADERASVAGEIMELIFAGSFTFDFVDRLSGDDFIGSNGTDGIYGSAMWIPNFLVPYCIQYPFAWFFVNILWMATGLYIMKKGMGWLMARQLGALSYTKVTNRRVDLEKLNTYLNTKKGFTSYDATGEVGKTRRASMATMIWEEDDKDVWDGEPPKIKLNVDPCNRWILNIRISWNLQRQKNSGVFLFNKFLKILYEEDVLEEDPGSGDVDEKDEQEKGSD